MEYSNEPSQVQMDIEAKANARHSEIVSTIFPVGHSIPHLKRTEDQRATLLSQILGWSDFSYMRVDALIERFSSSQFFFQKLAEAENFQCTHGFGYVFNYSSNRIYPCEDIVFMLEGGDAALCLLGTKQDDNYAEMTTWWLAVRTGNMEERFRQVAQQIRDWIQEEAQLLSYRTDLDDVILPNEQKARLVNEVESFISARDYYRSGLRIPWKKGLLFFGSPGNGKTMMIRILKQHFGLVDINLKDHISHGRICLEHSNPNSELPSLLYIEDIDKVFPNTRRELMVQDTAYCAMNELLQFLDGVRVLDGYLIIGTTNTMALDETLVNRPGRFDTIYHFASPDAALVREYFKHYNFAVVDEDTGEDRTELLVEALAGQAMSYTAGIMIDLKAQFRSNTVPSKPALESLSRIMLHKCDPVAHSRIL